ncbi:hypothetical protein HY621_03945 [Candidatus Uhrbacteria bacterium]|nr:hypothetical protein [Candidatus Uhrbacteria bacterium]
MQEHDLHRSKKWQSDTPRSIPYGLLSFFIFAGAGVLVFGVYLMVQNIREPFQFRGGSSRASSFPDLSSQDASKEALRSSDTDRDTLSDYDELYVYRTSPYLADTDSDGYDDKQEIATGHDPNCATGDNCVAPAFSSTSTDTGVGSGSGFADLGGIFGGKSPQSIYELGALSVEQIKELLKSQGVTDEQLKGVDDNALQEMYQKTYKDFLQKYENSGATPLPAKPLPQTQATQGSIDESKLQNPETLTSQEIRELVRSVGTIPEAQLNAVDDATLKELFLKSIKQAQQQ